MSTNENARSHFESYQGGKKHIGLSELNKLYSENGKSLIKDEKNDIDQVKALRAHFFGKFTIFSMKSNLPIQWRTTKSEELFAFLLSNGSRRITKREICDALWPDGSNDISNSLHTSIYKMKIAMRDEGFDIQIKYNNGCYIMDFPEVNCDIFEFINIYRNIYKPTKKINDENCDLIEKAISLYRDDYLIDNDYIWSLSEKEIMRERFNSMANGLAKYYFDKRDYVSAKKIIIKLIDNDNLDESAHELLLNLFILKMTELDFIDITMK